MINATRSRGLGPAHLVLAILLWPPNSGAQPARRRHAAPAEAAPQREAATTPPPSEPAPRASAPSEPAAEPAPARAATPPAGRPYRALRFTLGQGLLLGGVGNSGQYTVPIDAEFVWYMTPEIRLSAGLQGRFPDYGTGGYATGGAGVRFGLSERVLFGPDIRVLTGVEYSADLFHFEVGIGGGLMLEYRLPRVGFVGGIGVTTFYPQSYLSFDLRLGIELPI